MVLTNHKLQSPVAVIRKFKKKFGNHLNRSFTTIKQTKYKFKETGIVLDSVQVMGSRGISGRTEVILKKVTEECEGSLSVSVQKVAQNVDLSKRIDTEKGCEFVPLQNPNRSTIDGIGWFRVV